MKRPHGGDSRPKAEDPIVTALVPDPASVPDLRVLVGHPGRSARAKHMRLYTTGDVSSFIEIPEADILHTVNLRSSMDPVGRSAIWIKRDSKIVSTAQSTRERQAEWLSGMLQANAIGAGIAPFAGSFSLTARSDIGPTWCPACTAVPTVAMLDGGPVFANALAWTQPFSTCASNCV